MGLLISRLCSDYLGSGLSMCVLLENSGRISSASGGARGMASIDMVTTFLWAYAILTGGRHRRPQPVLLQPRPGATLNPRGRDGANLMGINAVHAKTVASALGCFRAVRVVGGL